MRQADLDLVGMLHHVIVGNDVAVTIDNEAGASGFTAETRRGRLALRTPEEAPEQVHLVLILFVAIRGWTAPPGATLFFRRVVGADVHHRRLQRLGQFRELAGKLDGRWDDQGSCVGRREIASPGRTYIGIDQCADENPNGQGKQQQTKGQKLLAANLFK
ncbi:MAG: hypothetical protein NTY38_19150 [Acidobacteria bacterium]|nr:hypothetical protein [Acidobacteriota bacterium]